MLLSYLYKKPIIDNNSAQNLGEIFKIHINNRKIDYILTSNDVKINSNHILQISDAIMYKSECRYYPNFRFYQIANQMVTDEKGKIYGNLIDLFINKNFEITKIMTNNKNLLNVEIISFSKDTLVFKRIPKAKKQAKSKQTEIETKQSPCIATVLCNYGFLIGRIMQKSIIVNGKIIIPIGKKITKQDIDTAQQYGKLIDITIYSKNYNIENLWFSAFLLLHYNSKQS